MTIAWEALTAEAAAILRDNDRGGYTVPARGLYPFQWNWDSCFVALGWKHLDEDRAWLEIETLFHGQWDDGMLPHVIFHRPDPGYFPGPEHWGVDRSPPTSGITQPPVAATSVRSLLEGARDSAAAEARARALFPKIVAFHRWFHHARGDGDLVAIIHPWESGRDNLPDWDLPLSRVATGDGPPYDRRDTQHVAADQRPEKLDYDRYMALVGYGRARNWDAEAIRASAPFWVADVGVNAILLRADKDLLALARRWGERAVAAEIEAWTAAGTRGLTRLWESATASFRSLDLLSREPAGGVGAGTFLPLYAGAADAQQAAALAARLKRWLGRACFAVPSHDPESSVFDARRYWRGPVWLIMNRMIAEGFAAYGHGNLAERIRTDSARLVAAGGFAEYFEPFTGEGLGGDSFSWTAAIWLDWVRCGRRCPEDRPEPRIRA